jgi:hypothetical protein
VLASTQAAVYGTDAGLALTCALQFVAAVGVTVFFTLWEVSLQEHIPPAALSRVSSWDYLSSSALMPVGVALAGPVAVAVGTRAALFGMSALGVASAVAFLSMPSVRALPRGTEHPEPLGVEEVEALAERGASEGVRGPGVPLGDDAH